MSTPDYFVVISKTAPPYLYCGEDGEAVLFTDPEVAWNEAEEQKFHSDCGFRVIDIEGIAATKDQDKRELISKLSEVWRSHCSESAYLDASELMSSLDDGWLLHSAIVMLKELSNENQVSDLIADRDRFHDIADKLAARIAELEGLDIGEHSNCNCPWANALNGENCEPC